jgi:hypothetical protein
VISPDEDLARFAWQSNHFKATGATARLFLPYKGEISVFRHGIEPRDRLWEIGRKTVKKLYGAAMLKANVVMEFELELISDEGPDRHAIIKPPTFPDIDEQDSRDLLIATKLAARSSMCFC